MRYPPAPGALRLDIRVSLRSLARLCTSAAVVTFAVSATTGCGDGSGEISAGCVVCFTDRGCAGIEIGIGIAGTIEADLDVAWIAIGFTGAGAAGAVVTSGFVSFTGDGGATGCGDASCGCCCG